jgi:hypothetical protein
MDNLLKSMQLENLTITLKNIYSLLRQVLEDELTNEEYSDVVMYMRSYPNLSSKEYAAMVMHGRYDPAESISKAEINELVNFYFEDMGEYNNAEING